MPYEWPPVRDLGRWRLSGTDWKGWRPLFVTLWGLPRDVWRYSDKRCSWAVFDSTAPAVQHSALVSKIKKHFFGYLHHWSICVVVVFFWYFDPPKKMIVKMNNCRGDWSYISGLKSFTDFDPLASNCDALPSIQPTLHATYRSTFKYECFRFGRNSTNGPEFR